MAIHRVGSPPYPLDTYPEAIAGLLLDRAAVSAYARRLQSGQGPAQREHTGPPRKPTGGDWATPRYTGDVVADAWERAIAEGRTPDLET